jgi:hypothetical protein
MRRRQSQEGSGESLRSQWSGTHFDENCTALCITPNGRLL